MCFNKRKEMENRLAVLEEKVGLLNVWKEQKDAEAKRLKEELFEAKLVSDFLWEVYLREARKEPVIVWAGGGCGVLSVGVKMYDTVTMRVRSKTALFGIDGKMKHWNAVRVSEDLIQVNVVEESGKGRAFAVYWKDLQVEEITKKEEKSKEEGKEKKEESKETKKPRKPRTKKSLSNDNG